MMPPVGGECVESARSERHSNSVSVFDLSHWGRVTRNVLAFAGDSNMQKRVTHGWLYIPMLISQHQMVFRHTHVRCSLTCRVRPRGYAQSAAPPFHEGARLNHHRMEITFTVNIHGCRDFIIATLGALSFGSASQGPDKGAAWPTDPCWEPGTP